MLKEKACGKLLYQVIIRCILSISAPVSVPNCWWQQLLPLCSLWKPVLQMVVPGCLNLKKKKKSHSFINGSNPFSPTLYVVDLWATIFTGVFSQHWNWWISVSAHFSGKNENSLEAQYFTCHGKLFKYFRNLLKLRCMKPVKQKLFLQCTASWNTNSHQAAFWSMCTASAHQFSRSSRYV